MLQLRPSAAKLNTHTHRKQKMCWRQDPFEVGGGVEKFLLGGSSLRVGTMLYSSHISLYLAFGKCL